jgi:CRP-like cAMP-binding protein
LSKSTNKNNQILAALPPEEASRFFAQPLETVPLELGSTLFMPDEQLEYVYFPLEGVVSLLVTLADGETVESGVVGNEGVVGLSAVLGADVATNQALIQDSGSALRIKTTALRAFIRHGGALHDLLLRFTHTLLTQISQTAACNRIHTINERLARWLLLTHDRVNGDTCELTHDFLARMLGTRRSGVTVAASTLREAGLINYTRGYVSILDREELEAASCECYRNVKVEYDRLFKSHSA